MHKNPTPIHRHDVCLDLDVPTPAHIPEAIDDPQILVDDQGRETLLYEHGISSDTLAQHLRTFLLIEVIRRGKEIEHVSWDEKDDIQHKDPADLINELCDILASGNYGSIGLTVFDDREGATHFLDVCRNQQDQNDQELIDLLNSTDLEIHRREGEHSYTGSCNLTIHNPDTYDYYGCKANAEIIDKAMSCYVAFFAHL